MDKLTNEQLMKIIVKLDSSHKKENENLRLENSCLKNLMKENATEHNINMINHCSCHSCNKTITNYTYYLSEDMGGGEEYIETEIEIYKCEFCNNKFCNDCVDISACGLKTICKVCNEIRKQTEQIHKLVLLIE